MVVTIKSIYIKHFMQQTSQKIAIGIDIGGTSVKYGIVNATGDILYESKLPTRADEGPETIIRQLVAAIEDAQRQVYSGTISGVGIGSAGVIDNDGMMHAAPNFAHWKPLPLSSIIREKTGLPTIVENDANVAAIAELKFGAGVEYPDFLFVIWGTGIGGGIILDRKLFRGPTGGAGEFGHMSIAYDGPKCNCGNIGCVEAFVGQRYLSQRTAEKLKHHPESKILQLIDNDLSKLEPYYIAKAAEDGDEFARQVLLEAGSLLGVAVAGIMNTLDLRVTIIGGGISGAGNLVLNAIEESVRKRVLDPLKPGIKVLGATMGNRAGLLGAAGLML
jgi:glucokinase